MLYITKIINKYHIVLWFKVIIHLLKWPWNDAKTKIVLRHLWWQIWVKTDCKMIMKCTQNNWKHQKLLLLITRWLQNIPWTSLYVCMVWEMAGKQLQKDLKQCRATYFILINMISVYWKISKSKYYPNTNQITPNINNKSYIDLFRKKKVYQNEYYNTKEKLKAHGLLCRAILGSFLGL